MRNFRFLMMVLPETRISWSLILKRAHPCHLQNSCPITSTGMAFMKGKLLIVWIRKTSSKYFSHNLHRPRFPRLAHLLPIRPVPQAILSGHGFELSALELPHWPSVLPVGRFVVGGIVAVFDRPPSHL